MTVLRIATRASQLARWQATYVARRLRQRFPGLRTRLVPVTSGGDRDLNRPLYALGTIGVFCKEVHELLLSGEADIGVHSCKDLPTSSPGGIVLAALMPRHDVRDALIGVPSIAALPAQAQVATSSLRRQHQLAMLRPDLRFVSIRGNVQTRLRKLDAGLADATLLACAGLSRLGMMRRAGAQGLHPQKEMIPAPAQGAIAVDCRRDALGIVRLLQAIDDPLCRRAITIERRVLQLCEGGCSLPLGCLARRHGPIWHVDAFLYQAKRYRRVTRHGPALGLAERIAEALL